MSAPRPRYTFCRVHGSQIGPCPYCLLGVEPAATVFQRFWCCVHHPSAIDNFFTQRHVCEWGCHTQELEWYHNGTHPTPKSWGGIPRSLAAQRLRTIDHRLLGRIQALVGHVDVDLDAPLSPDDE